MLESERFFPKIEPTKAGPLLALNFWKKTPIFCALVALATGSAEVFRII
jgi:hypothetical protein